MGRFFLRFVAPAAALALAATAQAAPPPLPPLPSSPAPSSPAPGSPAPGSAPAPFTGTAPWIGVTMDRGADIGVTVEHVVRGSPAERGGVKAGDRIVAVDGVRTTSPIHVTKAVGAHRVGDKVSVDLERHGTPITASLVLAPRPSGDEILKMDLVGAPAPAWTNVSALAGAPSGIDKLRGRVVIVDFWASWCGPCRMLAPRLSALKDKLGAQGLSVVGITTDDAERAAVFAERHQMRYPIVVDKDGDTSRAYGITGLPTMLVVDKKGVVREVLVGVDPTPAGDARLEGIVKALLAEPVPGQGPGGAPPPPPPPAPSAPRPPGR
ncbi:MAG: redoxin domain-containing protein [Deltaproteobacteria bacterium]|nr:redoxin domain-containing protein [Deltaproteobacteria bacterium]